MKKITIYGICSLLFILNLTESFSQANAGPDKYLFKGADIQIGTGNPNADYCYYWTPVTGLDNPRILRPKANPTVTTTYTLEVVGPNFSFKSTDAMMVKVVEFVVTITPSNVCDGFETPFKLDILPAATPRAVLGQLSNIVFTAPTAVASLGNPAGSTTLTFSALDANYEGKITTTNWYSTQAGHCNPLSAYNVGATATFDGDAVATKNNTVFTISSAFGTCIDGESTLDNTFSGNMTINIANPSAGVFNATLTIGTFVRDMQASSSWTVWANSQYHDMVRDEEQYHEGQWEGTNGNLMDDLWDPALVLAEIQGAQPYVGATQAAALALANAAYTTAIANEDTRSANLAVSIPAPGRRCAIETEAKTAAGSSYRVAMPCAYSACP